jgi:hypothetical protein
MGLDDSTLWDQTSTSSVAIVSPLDVLFAIKEVLGFHISGVGNGLESLTAERAYSPF